MFLGLAASTWIIMRIFGIAIVLSLFGGLKNFGMQVFYCFEQRKRISGQEYGQFDPPSIQTIKLELYAKLPEFPNPTLDLPFPEISLPELKLLLPELPELPVPVKAKIPPNELIPPKQPTPSDGT